MTKPGGESNWTDEISAAEPGAFVTHRYSAETSNFGELWPVPGPGPHPVVVLVHGGFWRSRYDLEHLHAMAADLRAGGMAVWNLEYRRVGHDGGGWPGTLHDVASGLDALAGLAGEYRLDLTRVAVLGHSAGGQLAAWLAARHHLPVGAPGAGAALVRPCMVVPVAGVLDLDRAAALSLGAGAVTDFLGGGPDRFPERYESASPAALLPSGVRQVVVHGELDDQVPIEIAEGYTARARQSGDDVTLRRLAGTGHYEFLRPTTEAWGSVRRILTSALSPDGRSHR